MNRKISINLALAIAIIAMTVTFSVTMILSQNIFDKTVSSVREKEIMYNKLAEIDKEVRARYAGEINNETLLDYLGTGYMQGTGDANARYYTIKQYKDYLDEQSGKSIGVGIEIVKESGSYPRLSRVFAGSPAADAGFLQGETLMKIGEYDLKSLSLGQINTLLRGEAGTNVLLIRQSPDGAEMPAVELQRREHDTPSIVVTPGENGMAYVRIYTFNTNTPQEMRTALKSLMESDKALQGLVIDVRNNTGGLLSAALDVIDVLCPAGPIASQQSKNGQVALLQSSDGKSVEVPLVVLTNGQTAAGAELLALSSRDFGMNAKIVGTTTAGKGGITAEPVRLSDGSAISYTVGQLLTSKNAVVTGNPTVPDVEAVLKAEEEKNFYMLTVDSDSQIAKAFEVLRSLVQGTGITPSAPSQSTTGDASTSQDSTAQTESGSAESTADESTSTSASDSSQSTAS